MENAAPTTPRTTIVEWLRRPSFGRLPTIYPVLVGIILVLALISPRSAEPGNLINLVRQGGPLGPPSAVPALEQGLGQLWVHRVPGAPPSVEYFIPLKCTAKTVRYLDHRLKERSWPREEQEQ